MGNLLVNIRDQKFLLFEQLDIERHFRNTKFGEFSSKYVDVLLKEAEKMATQVILPTRKPGDKEGCTFKDGQVFVPSCYHEAYKKFSKAGWASACAEPEVGGQGMPLTIHKACCELFGAANYPFCLYHWAYSGAANLINNYGTEGQKKKYMYKMYAGEWGGTQCMTEPDAGTDSGAIRTIAKKLPDGNYSITGTKIFISEGDHDLTPNIIHTVLARIEGDPPGTKGLSMFLVPKVKVNEDGSLSERNDIKTLRIENKMGFHGNGTCMLSFGDEGNCIGELLGKERSGMNIMFQFINEERIYAGIHGLSQASAAFENAAKYAKERIQSSRITIPRDPNANPVPIIQHPDVRRMLIWMKSNVEGIRALNYFTAFCMDMASVAKDDVEKEKWGTLVDLLTPACKVLSSDRAMDICSTAIDVLGGYGYCTEFPVEQYLRDTKIACIYEGTNGIVAFDFIWRKLDRNEGKDIMNFFNLILNTIEDFKRIKQMEIYRSYLEQAYLAVITLTRQLIDWKKGANYIIPVLYAKPFLTIFGNFLMGWLLMQAAGIAIEKLNCIYGIDESGLKQTEPLSKNADVAFYKGKIASAKWFAVNILSKIKAECDSILLGDETPIEIDDESFGY
jgi:hypothetical protein